MEQEKDKFQLDQSGLDSQGPELTDEESFNEALVAELDDNPTDQMVDDSDDDKDKIA